jgi:hypothetical protein
MLQTIEVEIDNGQIQPIEPMPYLFQGRGLLTVLNFKPTVPKATEEMLLNRKTALTELRGLGGLSDVIPDPIAWQRDMRTGTSSESD